MKKFLTLSLILVLALSSVLFITGCGNKTEPAPAEEPDTTAEQPEDTADAQPADASQADDTEDIETISAKYVEENNKKVNELPNPIATIEMENGGKIVIELMPKYAPNTVSNFVHLAQSGFYDGLTFHRVVPGFVIQGGDPNGNGTGGPGYSIPGEFIQNGFTQNVLSHNRGVISMARSQSPNSAGSQFFIVTDDAAIPSLDRLYAGFGMVTEGMEVVDEIVSAPTAGGESPAEPIVIKTVTIDTKGVENWPEPIKG